MLVETDGHTVPHFKAPVYAKMELWGPECGGTFSYGSITPGGMVIYNLNNSYLLHTLMERLRFSLQSDLKRFLGKNLGKSNRATSPLLM